MYDNRAVLFLLSYNFVTYKVFYTDIMKVFKNMHVGLIWHLIGAKQYITSKGKHVSLMKMENANNVTKERFFVMIFTD